MLDLPLILATTDFSSINDMLIDLLPVILIITVFGFIIKKFGSIGGK